VERHHWRFLWLLARAFTAIDIAHITGYSCGFGAYCRSFSTVQGRTRAGWKWPILMVQSSWTFTSVHRRWGQHWGQTTFVASYNGLDDVVNYMATF
jgi:hypothetical protein